MLNRATWIVSEPLHNCQHFEDNITNLDVHLHSDRPYLEVIKEATFKLVIHWSIKEVNDFQNLPPCSVSEQGV